MAQYAETGSRVDVVILPQVMKNMKAPAAGGAYGSMQPGNYGGVPQAPPGSHGTLHNSFGF